MTKSPPCIYIYNEDDEAQDNEGQSRGARAPSARVLKSGKKSTVQGQLSYLPNVLIA